MRIALYSDLHLEMVVHRKGALAWEPPVLDVDVAILAGDIGSHAHGIEWAETAFRKWPASPEIIYVVGNHEYYGAHIPELTAELRKTAKHLGVHFLENDAIEIDGVRFLGTALWSDFQLYGKEHRISRLAMAKNYISDYSTIFGADQKFIEPSDTIQLHHDARAFLERELAKPFDGKTIVVTHFSPHRGCVAPRFDGEALTPYFTVDMAALMHKHPIALWAFGHTHHNVDFVEEDGCRVISNQRGYPHEQSPGFRDNLVIEV
ncbi:metallophosphoesterase [Sulfuricella sp.]|uniref:metallophosphoesterase n=1 Tax=Sulfuricella sp. TaxID=2099377 RepID=UPI002C0646DB|nr:metallophosphoesterase [Sulfuricella sp.]HUX62226.1 metallophosphoesterase [Sulfuricella sp.]